MSNFKQKIISIRLKVYAEYYLYKYIVILDIVL
jgi:hypothetical protein